MSLAIYITEGFGIPFVLFRSSSEAKLNFLPGNPGFLFFNLPICQKRIAWKTNLSAAEVLYMLDAISHRKVSLMAGHTEKAFQGCVCSPMKVGMGGGCSRNASSTSIHRVLTQFLHRFFPTTFSPLAAQRGKVG